MSNSVFKVAVVEITDGCWHNPYDWMICLNAEEADAFKKELNNDKPEQKIVNWYIVAQGNPIPIDLNDAQMEVLKKQKRMWLSELKNYY
jgi:hypothetical protein